MVHFCGVTFYAIFASGEKQPWADPPADEVPPTPTSWKSGKDGSFKGGIGPGPEKIPDYGATYDPTDPRMDPGYGYGADPSLFQTKEEFVQVAAKDRYLNGDIKDREF